MDNRGPKNRDVRTADPPHSTVADRVRTLSVGQSADSGVNAMLAGLPPELYTAGGMLAMADLLPVMIAYADRGCVYRFMNRTFAEWLGIPRSEIIGRHSSDIIGAKAFEERRAMIEQALRGERTFFAAEFDHPVRGRVAVQSDYVPWTGADGKVNGVIILVSDVTEQRNAERAVRESEARFRRIANSAPVIIWVTRGDGKREFVNDAYVQFTGLSRKEAGELDWRDSLHPEDRERVLSEGEPLAAAGEPVAFEGRFRRYDGEYRWLRAVSMPRFGPGGEFIGFIGVATDVTIAKQAETRLKALVRERTRELVESESRFRAIFDAVLGVIILMEADGTVIEINQTESPWRAPNAIEGLGKKLWDIPTMKLYPQHRQLMKAAVRDAAKGERFGAQLPMERPGMSTVFLDIALEPVRGEDGKVRHILFEARDITDLRAAQEQLRQSQKMEALGQLTGGIAHDFNNLLTVVVGGLDLVAKGIDDEKLKRYATNALNAAERGARLTSQLLAFSRVQRLEVRPVHVAPLIQNMRPLLRNVLGPGITKTFDLDDSMIPIMADPTQLEVAILNLAINARDAMPSGGVLHFATSAVTIESDGELDAGDYIELCISDTGTGMSEDVASRAFEPFFTTKEVGKGTGLGLSMVYGMARQSGGTARIESSPDGGTAVKLFFKAAGAISRSAGQQQDEELQSARCEQASVLVIDDDPDVRSFIVEALSDQKFQVRDCPDGKSGLKAFASERPDLVVLDFVMPEMSGADIAKRVLKQDPKQKILFVSGYSETDSIRKVAPDAPLLPKPFRAEALVKAVQRTLAKN